MLRGKLQSFLFCALALCAGLQGSAAARSLLQDTLALTGEYGHAVVGNESLSVPTVMFKLGPSMAPASAPLEATLLPLALAPVTAPAAAQAEDVAVNGRKLLGSPAPAPGPVARAPVPAPVPAMLLPSAPVPSHQAACIPLSELLQDPAVSRFANLATAGNLTGQITRLGSDDYTLLVPNNEALAAAGSLSSSNIGSSIQGNAMLQQLIAQSLLVGRPSLESLTNGQVLPTRLPNSPLTVNRNGNDVTLKSNTQSSVRILSARSSCTVSMFVTSGLLLPGMSG